MSPQERFQALAQRLLKKWQQESVNSPVMGARVDVNAGSIDDGGQYNVYGRTLPASMTDDLDGWAKVADFGSDE